ncbi:helix-turn-helix domain-containing protein [Patescibacteria group bacterium]
MKADDFISTTELAKILGISRIAVYNKIKKGQIKAKKVGRNFVIDKKDVGLITGDELSEQEKTEIEKAVGKTVSDYGETLKLLGDA